MAKNKKTSHSRFGTGFAFGAAVVAGLAGSYFLYGPEGKKHRKQIRGWAVKAKGEVLSELENMQEVTEEKYHKVVDKVTARYEKLRHVGEAEAKKLNRELKRYWQDISKDLAAKRSKGGKSTGKKSSGKKRASTSKKTTGKKRSSTRKSAKK